MITIDGNLIVPMAYSTISGVMFPTIRLFLLEDIVAFPIHTNVSSIDDDIQINIEESEIIDTYTYIEILYEVQYRYTLKLMKQQLENPAFSALTTED